VLVAIEPRAERGPRVVEVEGDDPPESHVLGALLHHAPPPVPDAQVVAGREEMAGVETDPEPLGPGRPSQQLAQLPQPAAQHVAAPAVFSSAIRTR